MGLCDVYICPQIVPYLRITSGGKKSSILKGQKLNVNLVTGFMEK